MFIKNTKVMKNFVFDWRKKSVLNAGNDQSSFARLYNKNHLDINKTTTIVPMRMINSYCKEHQVSRLAYQPGDFVVNFPGQCRKRQDEYASSLGYDISNLGDLSEWE